MDSALDKNKVKLGVLILSILLEVLAHCDRLLDEVVQILRDLGSHTLGLEDSEDLSTSDSLQLGDSKGISQSNTDLRRSEALLRQLDDMLNDILGLEFQPGWRFALVRKS